jgi:acetate kinase
MQVIQNNVLTINGGSSSIRFAMYQTEGVLVPVLSGSIENINSQNTTFSFTNSISKEEKSFTIEINDFEESANYLADWLELQVDFSVIKAVGHRLVHGMQHTEAQRITAELLNELKEIRSYDPEHLPGEIKLIEIFKMRYPACIQVACFDTAFHTSMPHIAKLLPIPRKYFEMGIKRYGFHGLSYAYLMQELQRRAGKQTAGGKIVLAHLGNGASLAAVKNGKCIDTSMGFTPTSGLVMGTRTGDLDPGVAWYLLQVEKLTPEKFNQLINHESGLLGVSTTSADMKEIVKIKNTDTRAAEAFELFCYQAKKFVGAYTATLEGLDTLVFSGGIGEHSPEVRSRICDGMEFLGIELCEIKNMNNEMIISTKTSKVTVYVIKTNEELMMAEMVCEVLNSQKNNI